MPSVPTTDARLRLYDRRRDDPQVTPYRRPVHTVAIAGKPGVAVLGISHDGVALTAPVRMTPPQLLAFLGRAAAVAVLTGLAPEEIVDAVADTLGVTRVTVAPPAALAVLADPICIDCKRSFSRTSRRTPPKRCPDCAITHRRGYNRAYYDRTVRAVSARPTSITCDDCNAAVLVRPHGRIPTWCATCRAKRYGKGAT